MFLMRKMSYKNQLQEYLQKLKQPLPKYSTIAVNEYWQSTVLIGKNRYTGEPSQTKVEAEQSAALIGLNSLSTNELLPIYQLPLNAETYILIDIESVPHVVSTKLNYSDNSAIIGFMSSYHHLNVEPKLTQLKSKLYVNVINSTERDATDHLLTFTLAQYCCIWVSDKAPKSILIITKDHFGSVLKHLVQSQLPNTKVEHRIALS